VLVTVPMTMAAMIMIMIMGAMVVFWSDEVGGLSAAFTPKKLLEFGHPDALALFTRDVEPVLIDQHFRVFEPLTPSGLRDGVEDLLAEFTLEGRFL
jgi:hypothetical protein